MNDSSANLPAGRTLDKLETELVEAENTLARIRMDCDLYLEKTLEAHESGKPIDPFVYKNMLLVMRETAHEALTRINKFFKETI